MTIKNSKLKYNEDGFFSIEGWLKLIGVDIYKDKKVVVITATRNMGKSVSMWRLCEKIWKETNYQYKIAFARTNDLKMKETISSFRASFETKGFICVGGFIYKVERDKQGKVREDTKIMCGRFVNIENEHNYRSAADGGFAGFHLVFWDEFNEIKQQSLNLYEKWVNLSSTIERFNNPYIWIIIGNKLNANNDLFIKMNLNVRRKDHSQDYIQEVSPLITFVDIGYETYKHLNTKMSSISHEIARYDDNTNRFMNEGGFLEGEFYNVINHQNFTNDRPQYYFSLKTYLMEYGYFTNEDYGEGELIYLKMVKDPLLDIPVISLDTLGHITSTKSQSIREKDIQDIANHLSHYHKNKKLFLNSFDLLLIVETWLVKMTTLMG